MHTYLYRSRKGLPPLHRLSDVEREQSVESLGSTDAIRPKLDALFPGLRWELVGDTWWGAHANCQTPYIDILLSDDAAGLCKFIVLNKAEDSVLDLVMQSFRLNYACCPESGRFLEA